MGEGLSAGDFLVARSFGKTRILRVTSRSWYLPALGWHVRVRNVPQDSLARRYVNGLERKLQPKGFIFWLMPFYTQKWRGFDTLTGRARLYGFTTEDEAVQKAASLPNFEVDDVILWVLRRLPKRLQPLTLIVALEIKYFFRPADRLPW